MLRAHLADGKTLSFDLADPRGAAEWLKLANDHRFQDQLRGLTVQHNGVQYSLPRPQGFRRVWMYAELLVPRLDQGFKGGERLVGQVDNVRATVMVHSSQRAARVSLSKPGTQCYNPLEQIQVDGE